MENNRSFSEIYTRQAVVVFSDRNDLPWLGLLARGYRHCFIAVQAECGWIVLDPLSNVMQLNCLSAISTGELSQWYHARGYTVVVTSIGLPLAKPAPWALFSCVEAVKRVLAINARRIITPHDLWKYLIKENNP
jgi:hypothetical protein